MDLTRDALDAALDRLVEETVAPTAAPAPDGAAVSAAATPDGDLIETARALRAAFRVGVPGAVASRHLAMLTGAAEAPAAAVSSIRSHRGRRALTIALAAAVALTLTGGSALAASQHAVPGQVLYSVKRAGEAISLALHRSHESRTRLHLEFAEERLIELQELIAARRSGEDVNVGAAMNAYADQIAHVEDDANAAALGRNFDALLAHINAQLDKHLARLNEILGTKENERAQEAIQNAIDRAQTARDRVAHGRGTKDDGPGHGKPDGTPGKGASTSSAPGRASAAPR